MGTAAAKIGESKRHAVAGVIAAGHLLLSIAVSQAPSEGSWQWFPAFVIDFPFSLVWLHLLQGYVPPLAFFAIAGSAWWYALVYWFTGLFVSKAPRRDSNA